jgi:hypothetical protein
LISREYHFKKILFALSWCKIAEDDSSKDMLSQSLVHVDDRDEVDLAGNNRGGKNLDALVVCIFHCC